MTSYRRDHPDCDWFQEFFKVIRSGGDDDNQSRGRRGGGRRGSLRKQQRVLEQSEFRRRTSEVEGIMTSSPTENENSVLRV